MLTRERKYSDWLLEYVDAWRQRMLDNDGIIPTNIGLDGKIGGASDGKWYGGVYGWGFTVIEPQSGRPVHRNTHHLGLNGFGNAYLLTGDDRYLDVWRKQIDAVNAQAKTVDNRTLYPHMYGDQGWYDYTPQPYAHGALELYYWSMRPEDRKRVPPNGWLAFLEGNDPGYPERALRNDFAALRAKVEEMRRDTTTPDTRLADDPMVLNPATVAALVNLTLGGLPPKHQGEVLHCRVRYFDPDARRPGLPDDVAALVETLTADAVTLTLVNLDQSDPRTIVVQAGGYGEHTFTAVACDGRTVSLDPDGGGADQPGGGDGATRPAAEGGLHGRGRPRRTGRLRLTARPRQAGPRGHPRACGARHRRGCRYGRARGRGRQPARRQASSANCMGRNLAWVSARSAVGSEPLTMPPPANSRARGPSTSAHRSAMPHSPLPRASTHPTAPA